MWAGCIWVPIYEVMTRKHLKLVTLEENLEMAADIGMDATTSLDEAFAEAMETPRAGREGDRAPVRALPAAAEHGADGRRAAALPAGSARVGSYRSTAYSRHSPGTPFSSAMPRSSNADPGARRRDP